MTKVQANYRLRQPLNDALLHKLSEANSVYGVHRVIPGADGTSLTVEYDASRLTRDQVDSVLRHAGIGAEHEEPQPA